LLLCYGLFYGKFYLLFIWNMALPKICKNRKFNIKQAALDKLMAYTTANFENSALIIIDVQNDFTLDGAPVQIPGTTEVIPNIVRLLKTYRQFALPIIHIMRIYFPDGSNADFCRKALFEQGASIVLPNSRDV